MCAQANEEGKGKKRNQGSKFYLRDALIHVNHAVGTHQAVEMYCEEMRDLLDLLLPLHNAKQGLTRMKRAHRTVLGMETLCTFYIYDDCRAVIHR